MNGYLLLFYIKTTEQILMKFGAQVVYNQD